MNAPGLVTVTPDSMRGWVLYDDQAGSVCSDANLCNLIDGPAGAPSGTGSAELAVLSTAGGKALIIPDYAGVRLDQVTTLSYSTYRQTADNGNNLAIALQLNVDYDLSDASTGYQGRLVYEPYQASGGQVLQSTWQTWDATVGKWWGTRASVVRNGQTVANPCVQSAPCTWAQVLTYFPNIGVHATMGAIVLKAGTGWTNFRGNVDRFVIGINGATTTFDFELRATAVPHLRTAIGAEVVSARVWPADTVYSSGAVVNYSFSARPGRAAPMVLLDDTLAAPSGQFVMNGDHALIVESDTLYSYATLQPLEKAIADLQRNVLTASNKVAANQALINFLVGQISSGVDGETLQRASSVAQHVTIDPVRDSVALDQIDAALDNQQFFVDIYSDGTFGTYSMLGTPGLEPPLASVAPTGSGATLAPSSSATLTPSAFRPMQSRSARRIGPKGLSMGAARIPIPTRPMTETLANPEDPGEYTYIVVTNGIWNTFAEADAFLQQVTRIAHRQQRFNQDWTSIVLHYNRTSSTEMRDLNNRYPCSDYWLGADFTNPYLFGVSIEYAKCVGTKFKKWFTTADLAESYGLRTAGMQGLTEDHVETKNLADLIRLLRSKYDSHVILVDHSEGTIIASNALRTLPMAEGHPINVANRCVAMLALSPAIPRASFGLDQYHLIGLLADHDVLKLTGISNASEWEPISTPLGDKVSAKMASMGADPSGTDLASAYVYEAMASPLVHKVKQYLSPQNEGVVAQRLVTLHKECVAGSGSLTLTPNSATVGSTVKMNLNVVNQNGRQLLGRRTRAQFAPTLTTIDSVTFLAYEPFDGVGQMSVNIKWNLQATSPFSLPLVPVPTTLAAKDTTWMVVVGGSNGGLGSPAPGPVPTSGPCGEVIHVPGEGESYVDYLAKCATLYHVTYNVPTTLGSGLGITGSVVTWKHLDGTSTYLDDAACSDQVPCLESVKVELIDTFGKIVGRTVTAVP